MLQEAVEVFVSDHIAPGEVWARRLETELEQSELGVLCLTRENFQAPWLLFEAGALAKRFGSARVIPYLIDELPAEASQSPLAQFQHVQANREDTLRLVKSVNELRPNPLPAQRLERAFDRWWPDFEETLEGIPAPAGRQASARSDREILETILQKIELLVQAHHDSAGSPPNLPSEELAHLLNLRDRPTMTYSIGPNLKKELRHLRNLGFIKNKQGPIGQLPSTFQLDKYFDLSDPGRDHLLLREGLNSGPPAKGA
jgi:hypothetical protein